MDVQSSVSVLLVVVRAATEARSLAIVNLATTTASDRASVAALTTINSTLTEDCTSTHSQLLMVLQDLAKLHVSVT